jgi:hypothetical protein
MRTPTRFASQKNLSQFSSFAPSRPMGLKPLALNKPLFKEVVMVVAFYVSNNAVPPSPQDGIVIIVHRVSASAGRVRPFDPKNTARRTSRAKFHDSHSSPYGSMTWLEYAEAIREM